MKSRILNLFMSSILGLSLLFTPASVLALAPVFTVPSDLTNGCTVTNGTKSFSAGDTPESPNSGGHKFTAKTNRITKITASMEFGAINKATLYLYKYDPWKLIKAGTLVNVSNESGYNPGDTYNMTINMNATVVPGQEYTILLYVSEGTANWNYLENNGSCDPTGSAAVNMVNSLTTDMTYMVQGYNYTAPAAPSTDTTTDTSTDDTTTSTAKVTTAAAPVVSPDKLAIPMNFRLDRDLETEKIFAWDLNKEKDLAGYVLYVYEATKETELEIIDIPDKALDNYNLDLAGHPLLKAGGEYDVKIAAKNTAGAVSEKTWSIRIKYPEPVVIVEDATFTEKYLTNPYVLGGLGLLLLALVALLIFLEKKYHGLGNLWKKVRTPKNN